MPDPTGTVWPLGDLYSTPEVRPAPSYGADDLDSFLIEGLPCGNRETRFFAYFGMPERTGDLPVPAMVLVHGGGGKAFAEWVRHWNAQGYAAIAMDWYGGVPEGETVEDRRQPWAPPAHPSFDNALDAPHNQWPYHGAAAVVLAHSYLRARPGVDPDRIGITGISWGGYLTSLVSGLDPRFAFAVPVYGCGFLDVGSAWVPDFERVGPEKARRWLELWDPKQYLPRADLPMLWVSGTNDFAYTPWMLDASARLKCGHNAFCIRVRMPHSHQDGWQPDEIAAFADSHLRGAPPLPRVAEWQPAAPGTRALARYESPEVIEKAAFCHTCDEGPWQEREWFAASAALDAEGLVIEAQVPAGATAWYMAATDRRGLLVSTPFAGPEFQDP